MTKTRAGLVLIAVLIVQAACGGKVITPEATLAALVSGLPSPTTALPSRLTATSPLLPPADTATPVPTATPVIYVVQSGDTLYSIAFDYGVNPDLLQRANGIEDPRFLSIGQELIIPIGQEEPEGTSNLLLPTPTPLPFAARGVAFYETPVGSLWCLGEVVNTTGLALANVQINVVLLDANGVALATADAFAAADLIPPGERSPFGILFTAPPAGWTTPQVTILRGEDAGGLAVAFLPISVTQVTTQTAGAQFQVSGVVGNTSADLSAGSVDVIVTTYNREGLVTGFRQGRVPLEGVLAPGATAPFTMALSVQGAAPADFHVIALGRVPTL